MSLEFIVKSQKLNKRYGETMALKNVDIAIKRGSIYGLVGNNGAGKTTFLKIISGLTSADSGTFSLLGADNEAGYRSVRKRTGAIIENPGFYPKMTAKQNLEYYRIQRGIPGKETVEELLHLVGLEHAAKKKFASLSLGMKQRLGIALALITRDCGNGVHFIDVKWSTVLIVYRVHSVQKESEKRTAYTKGTKKCV